MIHKGNSHSQIPPSIHKSVYFKEQVHVLLIPLKKPQKRIDTMTSKELWNP